MSNQVGDSPKLQIDPKVLLMPLDVSVLADLQDGDNPINNPILSGKCLGGLVYLPATKDIAIACGDLHTSAWRLCSTGATHTPSAATAFSSTIGDGRRKHKHVPIVATGIPNFISNELAAASSDVNTHNLSGKDIGALLVTTY